MPALQRPVPRGGLDVDPPLGLIAEASVGWFGTPGLEGHRPDGSDFAPQFLMVSSDVESNSREVRSGRRFRWVVGDPLHRPAPQRGRHVRRVDLERWRVAVLARGTSAQPSGAGPGSGVADGRWAVDQRVRSDAHVVDRQLRDGREPAWQDIARAARCCVRRHACLRRAQRRGLGLPHRLEWQLRDRLRFGDRCEEVTADSASCWHPARSPCSRGSTTTLRWSTRRTPAQV